MHKNLTMTNRLENALVSFAMLDIAHMLSQQLEKDLGLKSGKCFFDPITIQNLKDLAGGIAIIARTLPEGYCFRPWAMNELPIEQHFGMLRGQYSSSQMTTRDFIRASARCAEQTVHQQSKAGVESVRSPDENDRKLSEEEFQECGRRAFAAAMSLMEFCSGWSKPQLQRAYAAFCTNRPILEETHDPCQNKELGG